MDKDDILETADCLEFPANSIFFHETSCKGSLDSRQACSVESAARIHAHWNINVLFIAPATKDTLGKARFLQEMNNVKFFRIHLKKYSTGTPLEDFVAKGTLNRTRWRISHASDVLRYLTLFKWGGIYLDLDVIVAKPFTDLSRNWAARESTTAVAAGAMAFSRDSLGRSVAEATVRDIIRNYRGDVWGHNGPGVITRVLKEMCSTADATKMSAATCNGFEVYSPNFFYPIDWQRAKIYFEPGVLPTKDAYAYHFWNHITQHYKMEKGSSYEILAKKYCPTVFLEAFPLIFSQIVGKSIQINVMYYYNKWRIACKYSALLSLVVTLILIYVSKTKDTELYIIRWNLTEDISCHLHERGDVLTRVDDSFAPPEKSIYFIETSCRGGLTSRQACAVESAARSNTEWTVHVLFSGSVTESVLKRSCLSKLVDYKNVKLLRIHMTDYAKGTPLENMVAASPYNRSKWRIEHSSDVLRYLTLYKYGGVYMDSDVVAVKSLDSLGKNFAGRESERSVSAGVLSYSRDELGRKIANASIE
ncbi:unnamed protein product [Diatraea saccharalis]|uniref:Alpha 1,4-glycosyltransferase domain-containing protein n=1 Tax=Diatraea saccharalis TaxID=40085 RepID=A0A9N9QYT5_9NEOP|nr:unnamed protein product [Diatraea saccharalis]